MPLTRTKSYLAQCDKCRKVEAFYVADTMSARKFLEGKRWLFAGKKVICPECAGLLPGKGSEP